MASGTSTTPPSISFTILPAEFTSSSLIALLETHNATVAAPTANIPGQQLYALDINALQQANIQPWTLHSTSSTFMFLGCDALELLTQRDGSLAGEIKSMHTVSANRGLGIGTALLTKLIEEAKVAGAKTVFLETGSLPAFARARKFYDDCGFVEGGPYGKYSVQENSVL